MFRLVKFFANCVFRRAQVFNLQTAKLCIQQGQSHDQIFALIVDTQFVILFIHYINYIHCIVVKLKSSKFVKLKVVNIWITREAKYFAKLCKFCFAKKSIFKFENCKFFIPSQSHVQIFALIDTQFASFPILAMIIS